jgi:hypothetical protein
MGRQRREAGFVVERNRPIDHSQNASLLRIAKQVALSQLARSLSKTRCSVRHWPTWPPVNRKLDRLRIIGRQSVRSLM